MLEPLTHTRTMSGKEEAFVGRSTDPLGRAPHPGNTAAHELRRARTCYDHLAGVLGVAITDKLLVHRALAHNGREAATQPGLSLPPAGPMKDSPYELGPDADAVFERLGIDVARCDGLRGRRPLMRFCIDWTERRPHLAGYLGATLASTLIANRWVIPHPSRRSVEIAPAGHRGLADALGIVVER